MLIHVFVFLMGMFCRVLRPPGGGSSNIFGTDNGDDKPQQRRQQPATSNLFGAEDDTKDKVGKRQGGPPDNSRDNVFGGSMVQDNTLKENKRRGQGKKSFKNLDAKTW